MEKRVLRFRSVEAEAKPVTMQNGHGVYNRGEIVQRLDFTTILAAAKAVADGESGSLRFNDNQRNQWAKHGSVLVVDASMPAYKFASEMNRISGLIKNEHDFEACSFRQFKRRERVEQLEGILASRCPTLLIIYDNLGLSGEDVDDLFSVVASADVACINYRNTVTAGTSNVRTKVASTAKATSKTMKKQLGHPINRFKLFSR